MSLWAVITNITTILDKSIYKDYRISLANPKALYNEKMNDGELRQFIGGSALSTESTS